MDEKRLNEIEERAANSHDHDPGNKRTFQVHREDVPDLVAEVRRLRRVEAKFRNKVGEYIISERLADHLGGFRETLTYDGKDS